jgi:hypothetical protein
MTFCQQASGMALAHGLRNELYISLKWFPTPTFVRTFRSFTISGTTIEKSKDVPRA